MVTIASRSLLPPLTLIGRGGVTEWAGALDWRPGGRIQLWQLRFGTFGNSAYPALPVSFEGDAKSCRSLLILSGVYARESKRSHQSALEMCNLYGPFLLKLLVTVKIMNKKKVFQMCNKCCQGCSGEH